MFFLFICHAATPNKPSTLFKQETTEFCESDDEWADLSNVDEDSDDDDVIENACDGTTPPPTTPYSDVDETHLPNTLEAVPPAIDSN